MKIKLNKDTKKKLLKLATFLDKLAPKKFEIGAWKSEVCKTKDDCGTVACAAGWAIQAKIFDGMKFGNCYGISFPKYKKYEDFEALENYLSIPSCDTEFLFSNMNYIRGNKNDVATRIRSYVNDPNNPRLKTKKFLLEPGTYNDYCGNLISLVKARDMLKLEGFSDEEEEEYFFENEHYII